MAKSPPPFSSYEWMIAWRYLRARRSDGGVSTMTWISLIGITLAVFALVATLAIRTGLRAETVRVILGANAHIELSYETAEAPNGGFDRQIRDFDDVAQQVRQVDGVQEAVPVVVGRVIGNFGEYNAPIELYGIRLEDLLRFQSVADAEWSLGDVSRLPEGIALGARLAASLGVMTGDRIKVISPNGTRTAFGVSPRVSAWEVVYIFRSGHSYVDATRAYLPLSEAQPYLNRDDAADQIDIMVEDPEAARDLIVPLLQATGGRAVLRTWEDRAGGFLRALALQDNALYILLSILVLIASLNIVSGLIMLVKNKGRDIGILRTIGLDEASVLRIFFLVGASIGTIGTLAGVGLGVVFALNIDHIYTALDWFTGSGKAQLEAQGFFFPPAELRWLDVLAAMGLSLGLSFIITWFPARRAARMNPVEALRYE